MILHQREILCQSANATLLEHAKSYKSLYVDVRALLERQEEQLTASEQAVGEAASRLHHEVDLLIADLENLQISYALVLPPKTYEIKKIELGLDSAVVLEPWGPAENRMCQFYRV